MFCPSYRRNGKFTFSTIHSFQKEEQAITGVFKSRYFSSNLVTRIRISKGTEIWNEMSPFMESLGELSLVAPEETSLVLTRGIDDAFPVGCRDRSTVLFCNEHSNFKFQFCDILAVSLVCNLLLVK